MRGTGVEASADRLHKRIHAALPIRLIYWDKDLKPRLALACTYDISLHGARVTLLPAIKAVGEILAIEQSGTQICCRVIWIGDNSSQRRGQMGIQTLDPKVRLWESEFGYMKDQYDPVNPFGRSRMAWPANGERRKHPRFLVDGQAELLRHGADTGSIAAELRDLSSFGCLVASKGPIVAGTDLMLSIHVANCELKFKGRVLHARDNLVLGIEFREIRKGDRQLLERFLSKFETQ